KIEGAAEFFAVAAAVGVDHIAAKLDLVTPADGRKRVVELVLAVQQQGRLRSAGGERAAGGDGHLELGAIDHRIELGDGRSQLELQTEVVEHTRAQDRRLTQLGGVGAAAENAVHGGEIIAADRA